MIDGQAHRIRYVEPTSGAAAAAPGTVIDRTEDTLTVAVADGLVRVSGCTVDAGR